MLNYLNFYYWDPTYLVIIPALLFTLYAQLKVKSTFSKYETVYNRRGLTANDVARQILDENGLSNVPIEHISGKLTDHFDPKVNVVRLSDSVYGSRSVASIGVAAHEVGHAIQYSEGYVPIKIRSAIIPVTNVCSRLAMPIFIVGLIFASLQFLVPVGILLFAFVVLLQAVTLPVEFNASRRAMVTLENFNILEEDELKQSRKVLSAAALTYVAALLSALLSMLRLILLANRRRN